MAVTKEALVIILDIGENSLQKDDVHSETFLEKEKSCCIKLLQRKMFSAKKDEVGLIVMGSTETDNELNRTIDGYEHVCEVLPLQIPNWELVRALEKSLVHEGAKVDWLDALIVAMDLIKREKEVKKFGNQKIVLFSTFSTYVNDDKVSLVIKGLKDLDIQLIVISDNVEIAEIDEDGAFQGVFSQTKNRGVKQFSSERLIQRIINESDGNLCNFDFALHQLIKFQRRKARPWYWYSNLEIGKELKIQIACQIALKDETHFKWTTESAMENTVCRMSTEYFKNGEKIEPNEEDLLKGYMLGSTPIVCDESLGVTKTPTVKGIKCLAFTKKSQMLLEYFAGNGSYIVLPKKGQSASEKMFAALVQAMNNLDLVMIAHRIYLNGYRPKLVCLMPNTEREFPCLSMFEMYYSEQYHYWDFPRLRSRKTELTSEQYAAVDKLIDSMNLMDVGEVIPNKEAFPQDNLMNISLQYIYETITKRALNPREPVPTLDKKLKDALKVPTKIQENSEKVLEIIKELFPLEEVKKPGKRELIRHLGDIPGASDVPGTDVQMGEDSADVRTLVEVGSVTPAEDFIFLVKRGEDFETISKQIQSVIRDLVLKSLTDQNEKIAKAMMTYREEAKFLAPWNYNDWIKEFKEIIISRKMFDFWENVVVKDKLGLISISQSDLVQSITDEEAEEFYRAHTGNKTQIAEPVEKESIDDLFENM